MSEQRGQVVRFWKGPWDGQQIWIPTHPARPDVLTFPVRWHDGTWDNAHWQWKYRHRPVPEWHYECVGIVPAEGLTKSEREQIKGQKVELLDPEHVKIDANLKESWRKHQVYTGNPDAATQEVLAADPATERERDEDG